MAQAIMKTVLQVCLTVFVLLGWVAVVFGISCMSNAGKKL